MTGLAFRWDGEWGKRGKDGKGKEGQGEGDIMPHNGYNRYTAYIELIERVVPVK